jgi:hypothetical protein
MLLHISSCPLSLYNFLEEQNISIIENNISGIDFIQSYMDEIRGKKTDHSTDRIIESSTRQYLDLTKEQYETICREFTGTRLVNYFTCIAFNADGSQDLTPGLDARYGEKPFMSGMSRLQMEEVSFQ